MIRYTPGAGEIIELAGAGENDEANLGIAEDGELLCLLQEPVPPLRESHLTAGRVVDPTDHNLPSPHQQLRFRDLEREGTIRERNGGTEFHRIIERGEIPRKT